MAFEIRRSYAASPEELFRAWVEPGLFGRWFTPWNMRAAEVELEARVDGRLHVRMSPPGGPQDGDGAVVAGVFRRLESPVALTLDLSVALDAARPAEPAGTVEVRLSEEGPGRTELVLVHRDLGGADGTGSGIEHEIEGVWRGCLGRLPAALEERLDRFYERVTRGPRFRSRYGGLWTDLSDVEQRIAGKLELGMLTEAEAKLLSGWAARGYVVLERAVSEDLVDRLADEVADLWERGEPSLQVELFEEGRRRFAPLEPGDRATPHKILDLHAHSETAREVIFTPAVRGFLGKLFERPALAFQTLYFTVGTEQDMHQDTAYVVVSSPLELVGCWIALEDVQPGSGELQYYEGSHRIPEYVWFGRGRAKPYDYEDDSEFLAWVERQSKEQGCPLVRFAPRKGDVLIWHADLVHGGGPRTDRSMTRRSMVAHLCPLDVSPEWFGASRHTEKIRHAEGAYWCSCLERRR